MNHKDSSVTWNLKFTRLAGNRLNCNFLLRPVDQCGRRSPSGWKTLTSWPSPRPCHPNTRPHSAKKIPRQRKRRLGEEFDSEFLPAEFIGRNFINDAVDYSFGDGECE